MNCTHCLTKRATSMHGATIKLCDDCDRLYRDERGIIDDRFSGERERRRISDLIALYRRSMNETTKNWCLADIRAHAEKLLSPDYPERERHIGRMLNEWMGEET